MRAEVSSGDRIFSVEGGNVHNPPEGLHVIVTMWPVDSGCAREMTNSMKKQRAQRQSCPHTS